MATTIKWDETLANDKEFCLKYYQSRADYWKDNPKAKKTYEKFQSAADKLRMELTPNPKQ